MKFWILLAGFFMQIPAFSSQQECSEFYKRQGAYSFHRFQASDGTCFLSADPFDISNFVYRAYLATNDGVFMVFNSYNSSEDSDSTGARVFHFFPRNQTPDMQATRNQSLMKFATAGIELHLSQTQKKILGFRGGRVSEAAKISRYNNGGVEISNVQTLYLDSGFSLGQDPTGRPNSESTFVDVQGMKCTVKNTEVFNHLASGDVEFKFTDAKLKAFLAKRCPQITVNF